MKKITISEIDKKHYRLLRENVSNFIKNLSLDFDKEGVKVLDVAPQVHLGTKEHFSSAAIHTLDIDPDSNADYIADLCENNSNLIPENHFDLVVCTEVLEHVNDPFAAVKELHRLVRNGGTVAVSTPFNFRLHNPLPDNWRFTIHGLRILFKDFKTVEVQPLEDETRDLMPIHHTVIAIK